MLSAAGSVLGETYGFDAFGNLLSKTPTAGTPPSLSQAVNPANNQIVGQSYDANGNQVTSPGYSGAATYDAENRIVGAPGVQYAYNSRNQRVWSGTVDSNNNLTGQHVYFYGITGKRLGTYSLNVSYGSGQVTEIADPPANLAMYFGGKRLDIAEDQLGSNFGIPLYPWGEDRGNPQPNDQTKFATYTRDSATLLDYANNRYYSNAYGRFMTPDPSRSSAGPGDPQSWNKYAYTRGDPVDRFDPDGTCDQSADTDTSVTVCSGDDGGIDPIALMMLTGFSDVSQLESSLVQQLPVAAAHINVLSAPTNTQDQQQALNAGIDSAWAHILSNPGCAGFLSGIQGGSIGSITTAWGQLANTLSNTTYTFSSDLPSDTAATTTVGGNQVTLNASAFPSGGSGLFQVTTTNSQGQVTQYTFTNSATVDALILLHELGHETGVLPGDLTNSSQNATNTADVITNCFTKTANGTYQ